MTWPFHVTKRSLLLLVGAVAVGMQGASARTTNNNVAAVLTAIGLALAYIADPPPELSVRDRTTHQRAQDP